MADNTNRSSNVGNKGTAPATQSQIVPPVPPTPVGGKAPYAQGFGGPRKEADTQAQNDKVAKEEGDEYWENYAREIELEKEIEEIGGIEKVESGEVKVPEDVAREMGVKPTVGPQTPMMPGGFSIRGVSLSDDQLALGLKKPTSTGIRWLVEWFIYQLLRAHYHIKRISGKILRVKEVSS